MDAELAFAAYGLPVLTAAIFGAILGSFLNVCILRLPAGESLVRPRSRCPKCGTPVAWYDNIPILSWLVLRGRCRHCGQPISIQYPIIEAAVALMWGAAVWYYPFPTLLGVKAATLGTLLLGIALTDVRHYIIPDEFSLGGLVIGVGLGVAGGTAALVPAAVGAAVGFALLYAVAWTGERVLGKEAMGGGDIKMMAMVGSFVGWRGVLLTVFGGALVGTLVFVPVLVLRRGKPAPLVPFGVFLAVAAAATFLVGQGVWNWYAGFILAS